MLNFNFKRRRGLRLSRGELLRIGAGNGQKQKYEKQNTAQKEEKGLLAVATGKAVSLTLFFLSFLSQLPALFSLPEKESMQELKTSTLLIVMALSHAFLSTLGELQAQLREGSLGGR